MNVPFSHPSEDRGQKDGRKVRSRWEGTLTFRRAAREGEARRAEGEARARGGDRGPGVMPGDHKVRRGCTRGERGAL